MAGGGRRSKASAAFTSFSVKKKGTGALQPASASASAPLSRAVAAHKRSSLSKTLRGGREEGDGAGGEDAYAIGMQRSSSVRVPTVAERKRRHGDDSDEGQGGKRPRSASAAAAGVAQGDAVTGQAAGRLPLRQIGGRGYVDAPFSAPPLDLSVKTVMRLSSQQPLGWFLGRTARADAAATAAEAAGRPPPPATTATATEAALARALRVHVYPEEEAADGPVARACTAALLKTPAQRSDADEEWLRLLQTRWARWRAALRSLYHRLRDGGPCGSFYVRCSVFTALFHAGADGRPRAVLSRSTPALRRLLAAAGVEFVAPNATEEMRRQDERRAATSEDRTALADLEAMERVEPGSTRVLARFDGDGTAASALVVAGRGNVHRLYDALLNMRFAATEPVPALLSREPFAHATALSLAVTRCSRAARTLPSGARELAHTVEVAGPLLPGCVAEILLLAERALDGAPFRASFESDPSSCGLNTVAEAAGHVSASEAAGRPPLASSAVLAPVFAAPTERDLRRGVPAVARLCHSDGEYFVALWKG